MSGHKRGKGDSAAGNTAPSVGALVKKYPIRAAMGGGGILVLAAAAALGLFGRGGSEAALAGRVDAYQSREQAEAPATRHEDVKSKVEELQAVVSDAGFPKLPKTKQDYVRTRLEELKTYRDYEKHLEEVTDPRDARNKEQLEKIERALTQVKVPPEHLVEWNETPAYLRHTEWLEDLQALKTAIEETKKAYQDLVRDGKNVIETAAQPNLPIRAQAVLARAETTPDSKRDHDKPIPRSKRITYATVFLFPDVLELSDRQWKEIERRLKPLLTSMNP
jgi:hypothetical protein